MASDPASTEDPSTEDPSTGAPSADHVGDDLPTMEDLTGGNHGRKAHTPEDLAAPQEFDQTQEFMATHAGVHGYGIGLGEDGAPCMVLFADSLSADQVPKSLDGLPVRVDGSGEFTAGG